MASVHEDVNFESNFDENLDYKDNLDRHVARVHEDIKCTACFDSFSDKRSLNVHILVVHEGKKLFECSICGDSFTVKQTLSNHISVVHEGKKKFKCSICTSRYFSTRQNMDIHMASVHKEMKK